VKTQRGKWSPGPQRDTKEKSAPSSGTACSLELSPTYTAEIGLPTPLPVGGTNTAPLTPNYLGVRWSPGTQKRRQRLQSFRGWECGGQHPAERQMPYPLKLWRATSPTLARWPLSTGGQGHHTRLPRNGLMSHHQCLKPQERASELPLSPVIKQE